MCHSLADGTYFLGDAMTRQVPEGNDDLETDEVRLTKGELGKFSHGGRGSTLSCG